MTTNAEFIVLAVTRFRENCLVLHCLSQQWGKIGLIARSKGRNALFQPMNIIEADITVNPKSTLWNARNFNSLHPLEGVRTDMTKNCITLFMGEVLFKVLKEGGQDERTYELCKRSILMLDSLKTDFSNFHLWFLIELASALGFSPDFGSIAQFADRNVTKLERMLECSQAELLMLPMNGEERSEIADSLIRYISFHSESAVNIRSLAVLHEIFAHPVR